VSPSNAGVTSGHHEEDTGTLVHDAARARRLEVDASLVGEEFRLEDPDGSDWSSCLQSAPLQVLAHGDAFWLTGCKQLVVEADGTVRRHTFTGRAQSSGVGLLFTEAGLAPLFVLDSGGTQSIDLGYQVDETLAAGQDGAPGWFVLAPDGSVLNVLRRYVPERRAWRLAVWVIPIGASQPTSQEPVLLGSPSNLIQGVVTCGPSCWIAYSDPEGPGAGQLEAITLRWEGETLEASAHALPFDWGLGRVAS
jgi:hypothetical protein